MISHKFRLYPSNEVEHKLLETLELCRQTYNTLLGLLNKQKVIDKAQIQGIIPDMKICDPKFKKLHSKTMQYECYRLFSNLKALSKSKKKKRKVGKLRFKGKGWFKTFTYNQSGFKLLFTGKRCQTLRLSKIGDILIRCHRNIKGRIKQVTIKREQSGKWFAFIAEETRETKVSGRLDRVQRVIEVVKKKPVGRVVGIDLGLTDVVYDSDGNKVSNPHHLRKHAGKLAKLQRWMSKKKKGSGNRNKARLRLTRQYEKVVNTRNDFLHKLSRYYMDNYDCIGMEDFVIPDMVKCKRLAKSILDVSWGKLRQFMSYKAERAGKTFITVNYKGTTQRCSQCGRIVAKGLADRVHNCPYCGFEAPRDYNSALEIKNLTLKRLFEIGQGLPESTRVGLCPSAPRICDSCGLVEMEALPVMATTVIEARSSFQ